jgi:hypothetical protein
MRDSRLSALRLLKKTLALIALFACMIASAYAGLSSGDADEDEIVLG